MRQLASLRIRQPFENALTGWVAWLVAAAIALIMVSAPPRLARSDEASTILRQQIIDAGLSPWSGRSIDLDETLRGPNRETITIRQFVGKPILAYNYAEW